YSDNLELLYLIPISFFRLADHYLQNGDSGDNAQIFFDVSWRVPAIKTKFYGTFFIDELQLGKVLDGTDGNKHIAGTVGLKHIDPVLDNSEIVIEYTRINPFVYSNFNPVQDYYSSGYQLGHWIGSNADQLHISYRQLFPYNISAELRYDYIRKGKKETIDEQYTVPNPPFLYGGISYFSDLGINLTYEPIPTLKLSLDYFHLLKNTGRFVSEFGYNYKDYFSFGLGFGL
ncbi:MAG: hypothetical protein MUO34_06925, partial [Ignavibacteriaceae bacterium]|nr:hypothetical protein [Ignavibacteriaceae bacterium]